MITLFYGGATIIFVYAAFWSFVMSRAMVVRIYRNHAYALGVLSSINAFLLLSSIVPADFPVLGPVVNAISGQFFILIFVSFFAFVDSTIPVARRSDPLLRPFLRWERTRKVLWVLLAVAVITWVLFDYGGFPPINGLFVVLLPIVVGVPALLKGARRSGDPLFRRSLKWVGLAILFVGAGIIWFLLSSFFLPSEYDFPSSYFAIGTWAFFGLSGYSFYRSARSLAPTNRLEAFSGDVVPTTALSIDDSIGGRFLMGNLDSHGR